MLCHVLGDGERACSYIFPGWLNFHLSKMCIAYKLTCPQNNLKLLSFNRNLISIEQIFFIDLQLQPIYNRFAPNG